MKKLYNYILPVLLSLVAVSCDSDDEEVIHLTHQDPVVTVESISPMVGYQGDEFTVKGTNFGIVASDVDVYMGATKLELVECGDEELKVRIPDGATAGRISVVVYGQRVDTQLMYDVLGAPGITKIEPSYGFVGSEITFTGHDLGVSSAYYTVLFAGLEETTYLSSEPTNESFKVKVPDGAQSGEITLKITHNSVNVPVAFTVLKHATLDAIKGEAIGYATGMVSIGGTNLNQTVLDETVVLEPVKAFFTPKAGGDAVEAVVKTQENNLLDIQIPATLVPGDYTISVATPFEKIEKTFDFTILPNPTLTSIEPLRGYVGATVTVVAENLGTIAEEDIQMRFGEAMATDIAIVDDKTFTVKVPSLTTFGKIPLSMTIHGVEMGMGDYTTFEVLASPVITSIETDNAFDSKAVQVGNTITIRGTGFQNSTISGATFRGEELNYSIVSDTEITASVSDKCTEGEDVITLKFNDVVVDVVSSDKLNMLTIGSDISEYVLVNGKQPFKAVEEFTGKGHYTPVGWDFNYDVIYNNPNYRSEGLYLSSATDPGLLVIQTKWDGLPNKSNGKMSQTIKLPQGTYDIVLNVKEVSIDGGGRKKAGFFVSKGDKDHTPNLEADNSWTDTHNSMKEKIDLLSEGENIKDKQFEIKDVHIDYEDNTTLGFAVQFANNGRTVKVSSIEIRLK